MRGLIRVDASLRLGSGHLMRCLTLAKALRQQGFQLNFICRDAPGDLHTLVLNEGFTLLRLPLLPEQTKMDERSDAVQSLALLDQHYDLLIVDHYQLAAAYCSLLRQRCRLILQIDDLANRQLDCDLLLDQNLFPDSASRYQRHLPRHCQTMLGPAFALLRDEFYLSSETKREHLLIGFGGSDEQNLTSMAILALTRLKLSDLAADIVIGANNPWRAEVTQLVSSLPNAQLHVQCDYMAKLMRRARLMLGSGGSSHWERCICHLPGLIVTVAENQQATTAYLDQLGACIWLGQAADMTVEGFAERLNDSLSQPDRLTKMAQIAGSLVPANAGTPAVVQKIITRLRGKDV